MPAMTRRAWLAAMGLTPAAAGLAVYGERMFEDRAAGKLSARERIQRRHLPNVELVTHDGKKVRFYDDLVKGKKVVINFMYAQCEGICVPVTSNLVRVQKLLAGRVGRDIHFYSISLKPEQDTPAALTHYMQMHHVGPGWLFLTGEPPNVELLRKSLGFTYDDPAEDADKSNHIGMLRFGVERTMRWAGCPGQANPEHIVRTLHWELGMA